MQSQKIHNYCKTHSDKATTLLNDVERYAHNHTLQPRMLSGRLQGRFLSMISKLLQPEIIVEVGTYVGYATLCLAEGLSAMGEIHTYEVNDELEDFLLDSFKKSDYTSQIKLHIGNALDLLRDFNKTIDLAFIDAGKKDYPDYYNLLLPMVRPGGLILIDNVLWNGKVLLDKADKKTKIIKELNETLSHDKRVDKILLPLRDGIFMLRKKEPLK